MTIQRESELEKYCSLYAEKNGWFQVKIEKTSKRGFPDRLFIRNGKTIYVEFKSAVGRISKEQQHIFQIMRNNGAEVWIVSTKELAHEVFG